MHIPIKRFDPGVPLPTYSESGAACFDLFCRTAVTIQPHAIGAVPQNFALQIPAGYALMVYSRSSTPLKHGLMLANGAGIIDEFYHGDNDEVLAFFYNITDKPVTVQAGDRIAQGMIIKTEPVTWDEVASMDRDGHGGYRYLKP